MAALRVPALAVFVARDVQVDLEQHRDALVEAADARRTTVATLDGANHLFLRANTGSVTEYGDLEPSLVPALFDVIEAWLDDVLPATFGAR